jgi:hypothetical protein
MFPSTSSHVPTARPDLSRNELLELLRGAADAEKLTSEVEVTTYASTPAADQLVQQGQQYISEAATKLAFPYSIAAGKLQGIPGKMDPNQPWSGRSAVDAMAAVRDASKRNLSQIIGARLGTFFVGGALLALLGPALCDMTGVALKRANMDLPLGQNTSDWSSLPFTVGQEIAYRIPTENLPGGPGYYALALMLIPKLMRRLRGADLNMTERQKLELAIQICEQFLGVEPSPGEEEPVSNQNQAVFEAELVEDDQ